VSVHKLYCKPAKPLSKDMQQVFVEGTMSDVREHFQVNLRERISE